jgi:two-component system response regulator
MEPQIPRVLLVEDNPDDIALTKRSLHQCGVKQNVEIAHDGIEALAMLIDESENPRPLPDLVLLDLNLPRLSGLEVLKQVRSHPRTHAVPVVVLTSSEDKGDLAESYRLGANSYIRKHTDPEKFRESIQRLCDYWLELNETPRLLLMS